MDNLGKYFETTSLGRDKYQTTIGIKPVNYQDGSTWKRISNDWADSGIGERPHIVTAAPFTVSVSPDGDRRIHPTREQDVWFEISGAKINQAGVWNAIQLGVPTSRVNNRITWNRTNFNAYVYMAGHYVKLGYLLKNGYLPPNNQFAYEVATNGLTRQGGTLHKDGVPVMRMRAPVAYDYDNPDDVRQIAHEIVRIDGKWHVVFTLPSLAGMSKPLIDPTLELQPDAAAGKDTNICEEATLLNYNWGVTAGFYVGKVSTYNMRGLLQFDISGLPDDAVISSTVLSFYLEAENSANIRTQRVFRLKREWVEGTRDEAEDNPATGATWQRYDTTNSWQTAGGFGANDCEQTDIGSVSLSASESVGWKDISITATSKTDLDYGLENAGNATGWLIKKDTEIGDRHNFTSSDGATAANRPKLVVNYTLPGGGINPRILQKIRKGY